MTHALKAILLAACLYTAFDIYDSQSPYQEAHWVPSHDGVKAHWAGNPKSGVHCHNNVCKREARFIWEY